MRAAHWLTVLFLVTSCRRPSPANGLNAPPASSSRELPNLPGFISAAEEVGPDYVRRNYTRGQESATVTLARFPMSTAQDWLRMSAADFPQATLAIAPAEGNGFYQCAQDDPSRCNLLVQLRCGLHLEIRGQGTTRRQDADEILRGLGLAKMVKACGAMAMH